MFSAQEKRQKASSEMAISGILMEAGTTPEKGWAVNSLFGDGEIPAFPGGGFPELWI
jgi:hypothetical protein